MYEKCVKRLLDIALSLTASIVLAPVMLLVGMLSAVLLGSPVLFRQKRPGKDEAIFLMIKFRSMKDLYDENGLPLPDSERLTPWGRFLRKSSLDELPELYNVLRGEMSLVGPRPLSVKYLPYYREAERVRHRVRPGLTGLAQVSGRNLLDWDRRLQLDIEYVETISFLNDLKIMLRTAGKLFISKEVLVRGTGVAQDLDKIRNPREG